MTQWIPRQILEHHIGQMDNGIGQAKGGIRVIQKKRQRVEEVWQSLGFVDFNRKDELFNALTTLWMAIDSAEQAANKADDAWAEMSDEVIEEMLRHG